MIATLFDLRRGLVALGLGLAGALSCAAQKPAPAPTSGARLCEAPSHVARTARGIGSGSGHATAGDEVREVFTQTEVTKKAEILFRMEPEYPAAGPDDVAWEVRLRVVLCPRGYVSNIEVLSKAPDGVTEKAVEAAREIRFIPAEKDGKRVAQYAVVEYAHHVY